MNGRNAITHASDKKAAISIEEAAAELNLSFEFVAKLAAASELGQVVGGEDEHPRLFESQLSSIAKSSRSEL